MPSHLFGTRCLHLSRRLAVPLAALLLASCSGQMAYLEGRSLVEKDQVEAGLVKYQQAMAADPRNPQYRSAFISARDRSALRLLDQADRTLALGKVELAAQDYQRVLAIDPANERARLGMRAVESDARHVRLLDEAEALFQKGEFEAARSKASAILSERPNHEQARLLANRATDKIDAAPVAETALSAAYRQPISIEFREAPLKQVFEVISRRSGLNFVFDKDVKSDQRASIFLKNSTVEAAIHFLLVTNQLEQQVMDGNTILVFPNVAAKLKEYQEMTIKTFYLSNAEAKSVANTLKTILKTRDVVVDEKLNLLIVRDSPEAIKLATKLVALQDVSEPEVMLEVEILEIKRNRLLELGIAWPEKLGFAPLTFLDADGVPEPVTLANLKGLNKRNIGVTGVSASLNANKTDIDSNTLANPRIRVRNKEKAKVVIGDKVPNITTTISPGANGFASESVTYLDVGLTLNVEPTIYLNNEIAIRIAMQVSNLVSSTTTKSGTKAYQIGTREATTMLQLKDGENQVLAGLISNEDRSSGSKVPGFGSIPILGRLFGSQGDSSDKTEIVLSITPHLVRNIQRPAAGAAEFSAGTESSFRRRPDTAVRQPAVMPSSPAMRAPMPPLPAAAPLNAPLPAATPVNVAPPAQPLPLSSPASGQPAAAEPFPGQAQPQPQPLPQPQPQPQVTPIPAPDTAPVKEQQ
ncbi:secretin N-terminal domain-containing protein [Massilia sp. CF038]|uniref:secretin N-terminal domain-containing protein n=1 Tax=Massilia sp. CF038 TaxID=1881045 RepID=UPI00091F7C87|nr:secretin N-terminal domain-containing protein [Massilia sp. CF038]SHH14082.1 general secretion pathway protein D [Massilia sp. CF038]